MSTDSENRYAELIKDDRMVHITPLSIIIYKFADTIKLSLAELSMVGGLLNYWLIKINL